MIIGHESMPRKRKRSYLASDDLSLDRDDDIVHRDGNYIDIDDITNIDNNPHLEQCRGSKLIYISQDRNQNQSFDDYPCRKLSSDHPSLPYRRRHGEVKSTVHWGQRKLMLSEIEFLTKYTSKSAVYVCVYAGAAPGTHISFLSQLFPHVKFILIDPSEFSIEASHNINIRQEFMTNSIAEEFIGTDNLLFISDVRSVDYRDVDRLTLEENIQRDMAWQSDWYKIMKPMAAMLKFRLPWDDRCSTYLDGDIFLPVWGPQSTTECRLVVDQISHVNPDTSDIKMRLYDHQQINNQLFYFNSITRCCVYDHGITSNELDHCYDCASEISILRKYLKSFDCDENDNDVNVIDLSYQISISCSTGKRTRTLRLPHHKPQFHVKRFDHVAQQVQIISRNESVQAINTRELLNQCIQKAFFEKTIDSPEKIQWIDVDEISWDDITEDDVQLGTFGGSSVPPDRAIDIWLWNVLAEISNVQVVPPSSDLNTSIDDYKLTDDIKFKLFYNVFYQYQCICNVVDPTLMIPAIVLLSQTNCAYILLQSNHHITWAKIGFPTLRSHHLTVFIASIIVKSHSQDLLNSKKSLILHQVVALRSKILPSLMERRVECRKFLMNDVDFSSSISRRHLLQRTCFESICLCTHTNIDQISTAELTQ